MSRAVRKKRRKPLTHKQRRLIRHVAKGKSLADAAIAAGYQAADRQQASHIATQTLKRLTGRPVFRKALEDRGINLDVMADYVQQGLEAQTVTRVFEVNEAGERRLASEVVKDDGRTRIHSMRLVLEAFEASVCGEDPSPWENVSDEELDRLAERLAERPPGPGDPAGTPSAS